MESGKISNEQISASSTYSDGRWRPQQSRLHGDDNGWTPNLDSSKEYLQVRTQIPEGIQSVCVLVGKTGGSSARVNKGHKEYKHSMLENSITSSIQTSTCSRHKQAVQGTGPGAGIKWRERWTLHLPFWRLPGLGEVVWPWCCLPYHYRYPRNILWRVSDLPHSWNRATSKTW